MKIHRTIWYVVALIFFFCFIIATWFVNSEIHRAEAQAAESVTFTVQSGDTARSLAVRLEKEQVIRHDWLFVHYIRFHDLDRAISEGEYTVETPITLARVVEALGKPSAGEREITIIPGWDLRDIASYLEGEGIISNKQEWYAVVGEPATDAREYAQGQGSGVDGVDLLRNKPAYVSMEGYLRPDTYRIFKDAGVSEIVTKLANARAEQFDGVLLEDIERSGRTVHQILTMASILEREVRHAEDLSVVSGIFWKRHDANMGLQADSTVHYATGKKGEVFTTGNERDTINRWNTYNYPGLPPGPISAPGMDAIRAAINPEKNDYWYFLTTLDTGEVKYARTLEEHNENVYRYLKR